VITRATWLSISRRSNSKRVRAPEKGGSREHTRREVLVTIAAMAAPAPAVGQANFLNATELECLTAPVMRSFPHGYPGAVDAGVLATIDRRLAPAHNSQNAFAAN
jgi:hypothetical protein